MILRWFHNSFHPYIWIPYVEYKNNSRTEVIQDTLNEMIKLRTIFSLFVSVPPQVLHEGPLHLHVIENHEISLPCNVSGTPKPKIVWRRKSSILHGGPGK